MNRWLAAVFLVPFAATGQTTATVEDVGAAVAAVVKDRAKAVAVGTAKRELIGHIGASLTLQKDPAITLHLGRDARYTASKMYGGRLGKAEMGTFDFFEYVFRADEGEIYGKWKNDAAWRKWRTYQMSDHRPLWIEFATDYSDAYLVAKSKGRNFATRSDASEGVTPVATRPVEISRTSARSNLALVDGWR